MDKLLRGIVDFRQNVRPSCKDTFARLALGQRPDTLFIACSDSRVVPNLFASSDPGDLFVIRNVGNLIPPQGNSSNPNESHAEAAAIEFALRNLPISEIIVCGHSECGAMGALARGIPSPALSSLHHWLKHGEVSVQQLKTGNPVGNHLEQHNQLSQLNVLEQMEHLKTYPIVQEGLREGRLRIHGWWFDIREADVYEFEPDEKRFHLIDESYSKVLLSRHSQARDGISSNS